MALDCGIEFNNPQVGMNTYNKDIVWCEKFKDYSERAKGKFEFTFRLDDYPNVLEYYNDKSRYGLIYISLRPSRSIKTCDFAVACSNLRSVYKKKIN